MIERTYAAWSGLSYAFSPVKFFPLNITVGVSTLPSAQMHAMIVATSRLPSLTATWDLFLTRPKTRDLPARPKLIFVSSIEKILQSSNLWTASTSPSNLKYCATVCSLRLLAWMLVREVVQYLLIKWLFFSAQLSMYVSLREYDGLPSFNCTSLLRRCAICRCVLGKPRSAISAVKAQISMLCEEEMRARSSAASIFDGLPWIRAVSVVWEHLKSCAVEQREMVCGVDSHSRKKAMAFLIFSSLFWAFSRWIDTCVRSLGIVVLEISTVNKCDDLYSVQHENCLTKLSKMFHCMLNIIIQFW